MANRINVTCCYKCEKREPGCHGKCETYIRQAEELSKSKKWQTWSRYKDNAYVTGPRKDRPRKPKQL